MSHLHWDHIQGLPFFATAFIKGNNIRIFGPKLFGSSFEKIVSNQMEHSYFPIRLKSLSADIKFCELGIGRYENLIVENDISASACKVNILRTALQGFFNYPGISLSS